MGTQNCYLKKQYGDQAQPRFLRRLFREIGKRGTLDVPRKGVKDVGAKIQEVIERLQEYHTALISTAVTGKIDLRGVS